MRFTKFLLQRPAMVSSRHFYSNRPLSAMVSVVPIKQDYAPAHFSNVKLKMWPWQDSNLQSLVPKTNALSIRPQVQIIIYTAWHFVEKPASLAAADRAGIHIQTNTRTASWRLCAILKNWGAVHWLASSSGRANTFLEFMDSCVFTLTFHFEIATSQHSRKEFLSL